MTVIRASIAYQINSPATLLNQFVYKLRINVQEPAKNTRLPKTACNFFRNHNFTPDGLKIDEFGYKSPTPEAQLINMRITDAKPNFACHEWKWLGTALFRSLCSYMATNPRVAVINAAS